METRCGFSVDFLQLKLSFRQAHLDAKGVSSFGQSFLMARRNSPREEIPVSSQCTLRRADNAGFLNMLRTLVMGTEAFVELSGLVSRQPILDMDT